MKSIVIARREILDILKNRKLMLAFLFQTIAVLALLPAFSSLLSHGNMALPMPSLVGFVHLAVVDHTGGEISGILGRDDRLSITLLNSPEEIGGGFSGLLVAKKEGGKFFVTLYLGKNVKARLLENIVKEDMGSLKSEIINKKLKALNLGYKSQIEIKRTFLTKTVVQKGKKKYSSFFLAYLVPLVLFFPLFFSGSLVMDSFVGEKDRKTIEPLVSSPIPRRDIVRGKFLGIWLVLFSLACIWFVLMKLLSIPIASSPASLFLLAALLALVIAIAILQAMLSENIKEANISMMVFYIFLFISIILILSLGFFIPSKIFEFIPFSLFAMVISGGSFSLYAFVVSSFLTLAGAAIVLGIDERLIYRDDIVFGGRASILTLASEAMDRYFSFFENRRIGGSILFIILLAPVSFSLAVILEIISGFIIFFLFGFSWLAIVFSIFLFAFFEEALKPLALYPMKLRGWLDYRSSLLAGALAGAMFFSVETLAMGYLLKLNIPGSIYALIVLRVFTTMIMHFSTGGAGGIWVYSGKFRYLALAVFIHAFFNIAVLGASL